MLNINNRLSWCFVTGKSHLRIKHKHVDKELSVLNVLTFLFVFCVPLVWCHLEKEKFVL